MLFRFCFCLSEMTLVQWKMKMYLWTEMTTGKDLLRVRKNWVKPRVPRQRMVIFFTGLLTIDNNMGMSLGKPNANLD